VATHLDVAALVATAERELRARALPEKAAGMKAYLKTDMPCLGVMKRPRTEVERLLKKTFVPSSRADYERGVLGLWGLPHREGKYLAIVWARSFPKRITPASLPVYRRLIEEGAWWDLVDDIAAHLVGRCLREHRDEVAPLMRKWIDDDNAWIRRTAILSQLTHKDATDEKMLFDFCLARAHETSFWIRKAIGWALRAYSYTAPERVRRFVDDHGEKLSGLSRREALKAIARRDAG